MNQSVKKYSQGFTLVEISIVMVIFGLLLGGLLGPLQVQRDNLKRKETEQSLQTIKQAITGFALRNGRIPCPDTNLDGQENLAGQNCVSPRGTLPWATLGVIRFDAWKQPFTYRVDTRFADIPNGTGCTDDPIVVGISFQICSTGNITVLDSRGGALVASGIPAIIVSHGRNWVSAGDTDEQENRDNNTIFVDKTHINQGYDDLVDWVNINNLRASMVYAGKFP